MCLIHLRHTGKLPDLRNPSTFNEKILWRKLNQRDPRFPLFSDKIGVKQCIVDLVGAQYVTPTLWTGTDAGAIPYERLATPFVIKANNGSGGNIFIRRREDIDRAAIATTLNRQMHYSHGRQLREWGYLDIKPRILIEPMIWTPDGTAPEDYKFFVYDGKVHFIQYDCDRFDDHRRNLYDADWNLLPATLQFPAEESPIPRPESLAEMIRIAERIGEPFDFVRVDLYSTRDGIRFGEVAFYPGSGFEAFSPPEWDRQFGAPWKIRR